MYQYQLKGRLEHILRPTSTPEENSQLNRYGFLEEEILGVSKKSYLIGLFKRRSGFHPDT